MSSSISLYVLVFIAIVVALVIIKKVTSCLFKAIGLIIVVAILAFVYFTYFQH